MKNKIRKLNLGCGRDIRSGYVNVDIHDGPGVDKVFDFNVFPYPLKTDTYDEVYVDNVLEHLGDLIRIMEELHRICRNNAKIIIKVPYYNCKGAYDDPTHTHYFNLTTIRSLAGHEERSNLRGKKFDIIKLELIPTRLGRLLLFKKLICLVSLVLGEIASEIYAELKVVK